MQKNSYINWLKAIGIEYYCSETSLRNYEHIIPFPKTNHQIVELQDSWCSPKSTSTNLVLGNSMSRKEAHPSEKSITNPILLIVYKRDSNELSGPEFDLDQLTTRSNQDRSKEEY